MDCLIRLIAIRFRSQSDVAMIPDKFGAFPNVIDVAGMNVQKTCQVSVRGDGIIGN